MRRWGRESKRVFDELCDTLQIVMHRVLHEVADISLICGHRDEETQMLNFIAGTSEVQWPHGKHNTWPSMAVDFQPYPMPSGKKLWAGLAYIAGAAVQIGLTEGITLRWGGDWNRDGDVTNQNFYDLFHIEVVDTSTLLNGALD